MNREHVLSVADFKMFKKLIYDEMGISLAEHKRTLVESRLRKWLKEFDLPGYRELYKKIAADKSGYMLMLLVNAITTNVTSFFREENQWVYLQKHLMDLLDVKNRRIRIWSAACSSGQEPYSIIMFLKEHLKDFDRWDIKILATDISEDILKQASRGVYKEKDIENMSRHTLQHCFTMVKDKDMNKKFVIKDELRQYVTFRTFNLVTGDFTMFNNKFDFIFCRNVMIYFDRPTQDQLLDQFSRLLTQRSRLFIGHSESIHKKEGTYKLVKPSIYKVV